MIRLIGANEFLRGLVAYNVFVYSVFVALYRGIDFKKHFELPVGLEPTTAVLMYYAFLSQAGVMAAEIVPKTSFGRALLGTHVLLSWGIIIAFLAPWESTT
jgi:hypothetical protein